MLLLTLSLLLTFFPLQILRPNLQMLKENNRLTMRAGLQEIKNISPTAGLSGLLLVLLEFQKTP
jgi:hypothetical protein